MVGPWLLLGLSLMAFADDDSAADVITLSDGAVVRGQVTEGTPRGGLVVLVRRDWAKAKVPAWFQKWERAEAPLIRKARQDRKQRLIDWKKERANGDAPDPLAGLIDREVNRLTTLRPPPTVLMAATLTRSEVRSETRQGEEERRLLRLGWLAGISGVETMSVDDLEAALSFRGKMRPEEPAFVAPLLPIYPETEERWQTRMAATEVAVEPTLRFVQFRQFILPETGPGSDAAPRDTTELIDSPEGRAAFGAIQAVSAFDTAVRERLADLGDSGRVGAIVSRIEFSVNSDVADAEAQLWVRRGDRWSPALTRKASAREDDPEETTVYPASTSIRTALLILESVASTPSGPDVSRRRQLAGTTAQRALGRARLALDLELGPYLVPLGNAGTAVRSR